MGDTHLIERSGALRERSKRLLRSGSALLDAARGVCADAAALRARCCAPETPPPREPSKRLPLGQLGLFGLDFDPDPKG